MFLYYLLSSIKNTQIIEEGHCGSDLIVFEFTSTYVISGVHHHKGELDSS
jgi:hypothetical protein